MKLEMNTQKRHALTLNPLPTLLALDDPTLAYFVRRNLLAESVEPVRRCRRRKGLCVSCAELITIGTERTRRKRRQDEEISSTHILDDPANLQSTFETLIEKHNFG